MSWAKSVLLSFVLIALASSLQQAQAAFYGFPHALKPQLERVRFAEPTLAPMAFTRFCLKNAGECDVRRMPFRGGRIVLTDARRNELVAVNLDVNRNIAPQPNMAGVAAEEWVVHPRAGDCNDYAVTKRHDLLARGWPSSALLLSEVVLPSGEHHLVLVVRTRDGDLVLDNLNANIRNWSRTQYVWVRIQSPMNPNYWSAITPSTAA